MSIQSHAFGRVTLTESDAEMFKKQIRRRPKPAAVEAVKRGVAMSRKLRDNGGKLTLTLKRG